MAGFDFTKLMSDPIALAGLGVASGNTLSDALKQGAVQASSYQKQQQEQADYQRMRQAEAVLPSLLPQIDMNKPNESLAMMMQAGVPLDVAAKIINNLGDNVRLQKQQEMFASMFGGFATPTNNTPTADPDGTAPVDDINAPSPQAGQDVETNNGTMDLGGNPLKLMAAAVMSGNPQLMQMGKVFFDQAAEQKKVSREQDIKLKERTIPGLDLLPDQIPDTKAITDARAASSSSIKLNRSLDSLRKLIQENGGKVLPSNAKKKMTSLLAEVRNAERALQNTGVLNVGEVPFLEETYDYFNPTKIDNFILQDSKTLLENLDNYKSRREVDFATNLESLGYRPKGYVGNPVKITLISSDGRKRAIADNEDDAATLESQGFKRQ